MKQTEQAALIWPVLTYAAQMQRVLTYGDLQGFTGIDQRGQGEALGLILNFCKEKGYPHLNTLVVKQDTGFPGYRSEMTPADFLIERAKVFAFNWSTKDKPRSEDFMVSQTATV